MRAHDSTGIGPRLRDIWYEFADTGRVKGWQAVTPGSAPTPQMLFANNGTEAVLGLKTGDCKFWQDHGFDESFWWSN